MLMINCYLRAMALFTYNELYHSKMLCLKSKKKKLMYFSLFSIFLSLLIDQLTRLSFPHAKSTLEIRVHQCKYLFPIRFNRLFLLSLRTQTMVFIYKKKLCVLIIFLTDFTSDEEKKTIFLYFFY